MKLLKSNIRTPRPTLEALIDKARNHVMTPAEKAAQRKSWVVGEFMLEHPEKTRAEAEAIYEKVIGL